MVHNVAEHCRKPAEETTDDVEEIDADDETEQMEGETNFTSSLEKVTRVCNCLFIALQGGGHERKKKKNQKNERSGPKGQGVYLAATIAVHGGGGGEAKISPLSYPDILILHIPDATLPKKKKIAFRLKR